jgi:hypothetical protein
MIPELWILIFVSGILHFGTLLGSAAVPFVLDWKAELDKLSGLSRQLIWTHGIFIVLTILGFGILAVTFPGELAAGTPLARGVCGFIALFWGSRLFVQFFIFDAKEYLTSTWLALGYHGLTLVFIYQTVVMGWAAVHPTARGG